ncbi:MAG: recombination protein RecR [Dehalobacter sp. 4CP]|uniref:recombination mediator RecR n=1 Tax=Dehalobacter sp. CP TaxID=2594474 RepID=UPI0013C9ECF0|nr:recombination mediator RecR [Dehalobacter sp.]NBJ16040.1 recombination protein RecR [Dehalobacter sp. 4CP]
MDYLYYPQPVSDLIAAFSRLPGVGPKTAGRLAFYLLRHPDQAGDLTQTVTKALQEIKQCTVCGNYTDIDPCKICSGERRDRTLLCVVEQPRDVIALEKTGEYKGLYHVLHGVLSPMEGIGPEQLNLSPLFHRLEGVQEVVLAVNPTVEGEATSLYISKLLKPIEIKVTKIAHGLPVGGDLEYADEVTIARALEGRRQL